MLEAVLCPDWSYRYYLYNPRWGAPANERLASCEPNTGDEYFLVFCDAGAFLKGFAHESAMTSWIHNPPEPWPGLLEGVPASLQRFLQEPAFSMGSVSFCLWWEQGSDAWQTGAIDFPQDEPDPDGSEEWLSMLDGKPATYVRYAMEYYERSVSENIVARFYDLEPLSQTMVSGLNADASWDAVVIEARKIDYPVAH